MSDKKFYEMSRQERLEFLKQSAGVSDPESMLEPLPFEEANRMVENAIGTLSVPMALRQILSSTDKSILSPWQSKSHPS